MRCDATRRPGRWGFRAAAGFLAACCCPAALSAEATDTAAAKMLIDCKSLAKRLGGEHLRILDVRPAEEYKSGHIPGAVAVPLDAWKEFAQQPGALHDADAWAKKVGALGIGRNWEVVIYGGKLNEAARVWWILKYLGHEPVRLLDGDWKTWTSANRPVETGVVHVEPAKFTPKPQRERLAEIDQVKRWLDAAVVVIIDSRTRDEYTGEEVRKGNPRGGHLPGALHVDWEQLRGKDGRFKSAKLLRAQYSSLGIKRGQNVVTHCNSGGRGAAQAFALELAGLGKARNYYCAFRQWSSDNEAPVVRGDQEDEGKEAPAGGQDKDK